MMGLLFFVIIIVVIVIVVFGWVFGLAVIDLLSYWSFFFSKRYLIYVGLGYSI